MQATGNHIVLDDIQKDYPELLRRIVAHGETISPRGMETKELLDVVMVLDPHEAILTGIGRNLSLPLISMEALQLISCTSWPMRTTLAAPAMSRYLDGESFHGAYGARIGVQLDAAINRLQSDRDTRQAVITIWDPVLDAFRVRQAKDIPCTTMLQFLIRNNRLILHVTMRSNDAWLGTPHDWGQFSQLQLAMAKVLGIECGPYQHHAVSLHVYKSDYDKIDSLKEHPVSPLTHHDGIGEYGMSLRDMQEHALSFLDDNADTVLYSGSDRWHMTVQHSISTKKDRAAQ